MSVDGASNIKMLEEDAYALTEAAVAMSQALENKDDSALADALDRNLHLWVAIRTLVSKDENKLPKEVKDNLIQLSHYAAQKTFEMQDGFHADSVESLIHTNLQIAEGLLEGKARAEGK
jgi:flagellar biosynthesis regulator FlaF